MCVCAGYFMCTVMCVLGVLVKLCMDHKEDPENPQLKARKPTLLRSLFTVGLLCKYFDLDRDIQDIPADVSRILGTPFVHSTYLDWHYSSDFLLNHSIYIFCTGDHQGAGFPSPDAFYYA